MITRPGMSVAVGSSVGRTTSLSSQALPFSSLAHPRRSILRVCECVIDCIQVLEHSVHDPRSHAYWNEPDYSDGRRRNKPLRSQNDRMYELHVEYPSQPGSRRVPRLISRSSDGKFVVGSNEEDEEDKEGGFDVHLPPNRYRTRSVALVATSVDSDHVYSNLVRPMLGVQRRRRPMVVEGGVYNAGDQMPRVWSQVVYNNNSNPNSLPRRPPRPSLEKRSQQTMSSRVGPVIASELVQLAALASSSSLRATSDLDVLSTRVLRASSPMDQQVPLAAWLSPLHNYSDLSSVPHRDRSMPSTLLTSPDTNSQLNNNASSNLQVIPETREIRADVHNESVGQVLAGDKLTYCNADNLFPNYALNYPTLLRAPNLRLSPSKQYPEKEIERDQLAHTNEYENTNFYFSTAPTQSRREAAASSSIETHGTRDRRPPPLAPRPRPRPPLPLHQDAQEEDVPQDGRGENVREDEGVQEVHGRAEARQVEVAGAAADAEVSALTTSSSSVSSGRGFAGHPSSSSGIVSKNDTSTSSNVLATEPAMLATSFYENWPPPTSGLVVIPMPSQTPCVSTNESTTSRPCSAQSLPNTAHDVSIDQPYEFDHEMATATVTNVASALPQQWNRPYLGYNPRLRMEVGPLASVSERVFSDSEIYSPLFPRNRPRQQQQREVEVQARVRDMRRQFEEYRDQQLRRTRVADEAGQEDLQAVKESRVELEDDQRLESLI